jgi:hypothetical protein
MSPEANDRPAGVVVHPLGSIALSPLRPGTVTSMPDTGCLTVKRVAAAQTPPATQAIIRPVMSARNRTADVI